MRPLLSGPTCRGALRERLVTRALSHLAPSTTAAAPARRPAPAPPSRTCPSCRPAPRTAGRPRWSSSSSSSSRWNARQTGDHYARAAKVQGFKSRAAFKLLDMDLTHGLFRRNQVVVDLGYAPGSWSQVAVERTKPHGVVVGIDLIPAQPPRGMTSVQGDFLSPHVRRLVREVLVEQVRRRNKTRAAERRFEGMMGLKDREEGGAAGEVYADRPSYIDLEKQASHDIEVAEAEAEDEGRLVDVVLSDMCEPWPQTTGFMSKTLSRPYRLMNTSGINFRDHALSMDLCYAALSFASQNLKQGGHFVAKFYQGAEDKLFQTKLQKMFESVKREKPDSSRKDSKEAYFVALERKGDVTLARIEGR